MDQAGLEPATSRVSIMRCPNSTTGPLFIHYVHLMLFWQEKTLKKVEKVVDKMIRVTYYKDYAKAVKQKR